MNPSNLAGRVVHAESGEGISGVAVSNGESIVATSATGHFDLEVRPDAHRYVIATVPAGFRPGSEYYRTISDSGTGDPAIQFSLQPFEPSSRERFTYGHITDLHVGKATTSAATLCGDFKALMSDGAPDFVIASGDLTQWGSPDQLQTAAKCFHTLPCPWFPLYGAHDGTFERLGGITREEMEELKRQGKWDPARNGIPDLIEESFTRQYELVFGPPWFSFDWGRWHFALFPNEAIHSPADVEQKSRWLEADLARCAADRPKAVVVHVPPPPEFLDRMEAAGVRLVLYGHWHSSKVFRWGEVTVAATPPLCFGGIDTSPRGYYRIEFDGEDFRFERRVLVAGGIRANLKESSEPAPRWTCRLPGHMHRAAPVLGADGIFVSVQNPRFPGSSGVVCVDAQDGSQRWMLETDSAVVNRVTLDAAGALGVAVSMAGEVNVFDTATGKVRWSDRLPGYPYRWTCTTPVIVGGTVIVGSRAGYGCWDLERGESHWYHEIRDDDWLPSYSSPVVWNELLIVDEGNQGLEAVDLHSARNVWRHSSVRNQRFSSQVLVGDRLVTGSDANDQYLPGGEPAGLAVLDPATGEEIWNRRVLEARHPTGLTATEHLIYVSTPHGEVQAYDMETAELRWRYAFGESRLDATPYRREIPAVFADAVIAEDSLLVGGSDGVVVELEAAIGAVRKSYALSAAVTAPVCLTENGFCAGTFDGELYCFDR